VDFYTYEDWANQAKTDQQMTILANVTPETDTLFSWVKHYDSDTRVKTPVTGMCSMNMDTMAITVGIMDEQRGMEDVWNMTAHPCKKATRETVRSPQLLATNADLAAW
jgi:hypothetical protein